MSHKPCLDQIVEEFKGGKITGWCPLEKALDLAVTVLALRPKVVIELGVWGGLSFIPMALACKHLGSGTCIGVDPWSKDASIEGYDEPNAKWWSAQDHDTILKDFSLNIQRLGLESFVQIQRAKSDDAIVPDIIDAAHIDGQHSHQASKDVARYAPHVRAGGIVIMDDLGWTVDGVATVKPAVDLLISMGFTELYRTKLATGEEWGIFQRNAITMPKRKRGRPKKC